MVDNAVSELNAAIENLSVKDDASDSDDGSDKDDSSKPDDNKNDTSSTPSDPSETGDMTPYALAAAVVALSAAAMLVLKRKARI